MPTVQRIIRFIWNLEDKDNYLIKFILKSEGSKSYLLKQGYIGIYWHIQTTIVKTDNQQGSAV